MAAVIELQEVSKVFEAEDVRTRALNDVSFSVASGEFVAITGPSGCGKSTLLSILGLLDTPTSGTYRLRDTPVAAMSSRDRARIRSAQIGFVFQSFNLLGNLTVSQNVELPLRYRGIDPGERKRRVQEALDRVEISNRARHFPAQLSGGQQQRVAVARAVAGSPTLLLADEPTGNLDSANGEAVMAMLVELHRAGSTICMVTHDSGCAARASRVIRMRDGAIEEDGQRTAVELLTTAAVPAGDQRVEA